MPAKVRNEVPRSEKFGKNSMNRLRAELRTYHSSFSERIEEAGVLSAESCYCLAWMAYRAAAEEIWAAEEECPPPLQPGSLSSG